MSFNYLELGYVVNQIQRELTEPTPFLVERVELVEFPTRGQISDLNVALRLNGNRSLVFSLKNPWLGLFFLSSKLFRTSRQTWASAFDGAVNWNTYLTGKRLLEVSQRPKDRVVVFKFNDGIELEVHFFPARPNWILQTKTQKFSRMEAIRHGLSNPPAEISIREFSNLNAAWDWNFKAYSFYLELREKAYADQQVAKVQNEIQTKLVRQSKIRSQMLESLKECDGAQEIFREAERLKAELHEKPENAEQMQKLYTKYKKLGRTRREVETRLSEVQSQIQKLKTALTSLIELKTSPEPILSRLQQIAKDIGISFSPEASEEKSEKKQKNRQPDWSETGLRRFQSKEGLSVWIGRNHSENEKLVVQLARGNDLWLHLKGRPGAHAVIQLPKEKTASLETLLDAAVLVAHFSGVGKGEKVEVDYTFRKYVKRVPKSGEKFLVTYIKNKTLLVSIEEKRLSRLMGLQTPGSL